MENKTYRAAIFDVDGTLLDTTEGVLAAVRYTIKEAGMPETDRDTLLTFIGPPVQDSFMRIYGVTKERAQELATVFRNRYKDYELLKAVPYDGIYEAMDKIRAKGVRIAVATYKRQDYAETILRHFGFDRYSNILYGADHENKLKKVDIIALCLRDMGIVNPAEAVMIGDSGHDADGAKQIGMDFIGVTYGFDFRTKEDVYKYSAIGYADTPSELDSFFVALPEVKE